LKPGLKPAEFYSFAIQLNHVNERNDKMKLALTNIGLYTVKTQKYISLAIMAFVIFAGIIGMYPPESGGGTGM
jgi:hypothetical protein